VNQAASPKSRLDRIHIYENRLHQTKSSQICPYFVDHAGLSLNILPPTKAHRAAFWRFRSALLNHKSLIDFVITIIQFYSSLAIGGENILDLWDEIKQKMRLQAQRYEDHQRRQKNKQQSSYITEKSELSEAEEQVLMQ
jgi:hypothetical protein